MVAVVQELPAQPPESLSPEERRALVARLVAQAVRGGYRLEAQSDYQAVMVKGHRPSHILHLILSLITLGLWAIVWILVTVLGGEKRLVISVDEFGNTSQLH